MAMTIVSCARAACAVAALGLTTCGAISNAAAGDAYWHGFRGSDWSLGISENGRISNWHTRPPPPPAGAPLPPPDGVAVFARHAATTSVSITERTTVATMRFTPDAPRYGFLISGRGRELTLAGSGLINGSDATQLVTVADRGVLQFINEARIRTGSGEKSARITLLGGSLVFRDKSHGGDATVFNRYNASRFGSVVFGESSSAGSMTISNVGNAQTRFAGRSTAGGANLVNNADFLSPTTPNISFTGTIGPAGDHRITAGKISNNAGTVLIGDNQLSVLGDFIQRADGALYITLTDMRAGGIRVGGTAKLGGELWIDVANTIDQAGRHVLIRSPRGLTGRFSRVEIDGFSSALKGRIAYSGTDVVLIVERK